MDALAWGMGVLGASKNIKQRCSLEYYRGIAAMVSKYKYLYVVDVVQNVTFEKFWADQMSLTQMCLLYSCH